MEQNYHSICRSLEGYVMPTQSHFELQYYLEITTNIVTWSYGWYKPVYELIIYPMMQNNVTLLECDISIGTCGHEIMIAFIRSYSGWL